MSAEERGIAFEEVAVSYGAKQVLCGVSGRIEAGRFAALIGPNGSGKSTLLRALAGLIPYEGSIRLDGREIRGIPRRELGRRIGMLSQQARAETALTVYDLIALGRLPYEGLLRRRAPEEEAIVLEAAAQMQLGELLFRNASRISGGEAQRSFLAMLLAQDPQVFLLDEPSSATDVKHAVATFSLFGRMAAERGRAVAAAVHDINLALRFASDVIALKEGSLLWAGPVKGMDETLLEPLYDIAFERFSSKGGAAVWHAAAEGGARA